MAVIDNSQPVQMQIQSIRSLYLLEQELFAFALRLAFAHGNDTMKSMAASALNQKMYEKLLFVEEGRFK